MIIITEEMEVLVFQQALIFGIQNGIHPKNSYLFIRYEIRWNFKKVAEKRCKSTRDVWKFFIEKNKYFYKKICIKCVDAPIETYKCSMHFTFRSIILWWVVFSAFFIINIFHYIQ